MDPRLGQGLFEWIFSHRGLVHLNASTLDNETDNYWDQIQQNGVLGRELQLYEKQRGTNSADRSSSFGWQPTRPQLAVCSIIESHLGSETRVGAFLRNWYCKAPSICFKLFPSGSSSVHAFLVQRRSTKATVWKPAQHSGVRACFRSRRRSKCLGRTWAPHCPKQAPLHVTLYVKLSLYLEPCGQCAELSRIRDTSVP